MTQDNFTILELISQSPTTSVYKAHQNVLDRTVLLKVLHKHLSRDRDLVSRFSREAKACAILKSENIVQVYDLTDIDGAPAIVMEYVEGKSLEDLLENESIRSEKLLLNVGTSVLKALSYAHDRGVTHRDIKPGNILVSTDGTIKVTDFGLAAVSDAPSLTMEGSLIGTPAYMSPEQARGEVVDQRTDIFSLGVTLVEVLTGDKILAGRSYAECINRIQAFNTDSIAYLAGKCSPHVFEFLKRMLAPDKHGRFASAGEALRFLEQVSGEGPAESDIPVALHAAARLKKRTGVLTAGAVAVLIIVVGLSFVFRLQKPDVATVSRDSTTAAETQSPPKKKTEVASEKIAGQIPGATEMKQKPAYREQAAKLYGDTTAATGTGASLAVAEDAGADSGYIHIQCKPWAKIYIDSEYAGTTPISGSVKIPVGEHTVTFDNSNFAPIVRQVNVKKNLLTDVDADFLKDSGYLVVGVEPWGKVYVDDQFRETTPSARPIVVSAGTRRIRIQNPNFQDIVKTLTVNPGDTLRLNFNFLSANEK